jgi:hypothetical protein
MSGSFRPRRTRQHRDRNRSPGPRRGPAGGNKPAGVPGPRVTGGLLRRMDSDRLPVHQTESGSSAQAPAPIHGPEQPVDPQRTLPRATPPTPITALLNHGYALAEAEAPRRRRFCDLDRWIVRNVPRRMAPRHRVTLTHSDLARGMLLLVSLTGAEGRRPHRSHRRSRPRTWSAALTDQKHRDSLALDLLEPLRPVVERHLLQLHDSRHLLPPTRISP